MMLKLRTLALLLALAVPSAATAQSAVPAAVDLLETFGDTENLDGRWILANGTVLIDLNAPSEDKIRAAMTRFCPEDSSPVMAIETLPEGFNLSLIDAPPDLHWQYRRDSFGAFTRSIDRPKFYAALGYPPDRSPSEEVITANERNNGPVTVLRPGPDLLLITHRTGFDLLIRCDS